MGTPDHLSVQRPVLQTPFSCFLSRRGRNKDLNTPRTFRLQASSPNFGKDDNGDDVSFENILKKQWKLHSVSPMFNFKSKTSLFKKYSRSLDAAFSQDVFGPLENGSVKSSISVLPGLKASNADPDAVKIEVAEKSPEGLGKTVLTAVLVCVDIDPADHPVTPDLRQQFTYFPVLMVSGNKARAETLFKWLEMHFDCHVAPLTFNTDNMRRMLGILSTKAKDKSAVPVLMQYCLKDISEDLGITTINCKIDSTTCKEFWERLCAGVAHRESINMELVQSFVDGLEAHLEYTMSIIFSKLTLSEVGTPLAYVSHLGKLKILSKPGVYLALYLICDISRSRYMSIKS